MFNLFKRQEFRVRLQGPGLIIYSEAGHTMTIATELTSTGRVIYLDSIRAWDEPHHQLEVTREDRLRICGNLKKKLSGWRSEVVFFNSETGETLDV